MTKTNGKMTPTIDHVVYSQLLAKVTPKIIETEAEYESALAEIEKLLFNKNRSREEDALYDLLVMLVEKYEAENHSLNEATPSQILQHLMDARAMNESDLVKILGNREIVTAIMNDHYLITISQAEVLAKYFQVSPRLFLTTVKS